MTQADQNQRNLQPHRDDAVQGELGDAWLIAILGAVAACRPDVIRRALHQPSPTAPAQVRLHHVEIDRRTADWTPTGHRLIIDVDTEPLTNGSRFEPHWYADTTRALWPAILERAFASIESSWSSARLETIPERGYHRLDHGVGVWEAAEMLAQLTGTRAGIIHLGRASNEADRNELILRYLLAMDRPILAGTRPRIDAESRPNHGLYPAHAYEITRARHGHVNAHNPWGVCHATGVTISDLIDATAALIVSLKE